MGSESQVRGSRSGRRGRVGIALGLCALTFGLLTLFVSQPLQAQGAAPAIAIRVGDDSCRITAEDLTSTPDGGINDAVPVYDGDQTTQVQVTGGAALGSLLTFIAPMKCDGLGGDVKGVELTRSDGSKFFADAEANIYFWFQDGSPRWQRLQDEDDKGDINSKDAGSLAEGESKMIITGTTNELADVTLSSTPKDVGVDDTVTFKTAVKNVPDDAKLSYIWNFGDGETDRTSESTTTHVYKKKGTKVASVIVSADDVRGSDDLKLKIEAESQQQDDSSGDGGTGSGSGGGSGSGTGGGTGGGSGDGFGGSPGGSTVTPSPSFPTTPTPPSTDPALPPPDTPPPSHSTPTNPDDFGNVTSTESGEEVTGIVIAASAPNAGGGGDQKTTPAAEQDKTDKKNEAGVDWKVPTGAILAGLLLILGGLREHRPMRQLLPKAT